MLLQCPGCHRPEQFVFERIYTDERGRRWELYKCAHCGRLVPYAVT